MKHNTTSLYKAIHNFKRGYIADGAMPLHLIDTLTEELFALKERLFPTSNFPIPPPGWQTVHIGDGIFVEGENPELNCEVG